MRCFIAAWPDVATRVALQRKVEALQFRVPRARAMQPRNFHLTLAFIGETDAVKAAALARDCRDLERDTVDWSVDCLGWFPRARVAWAGGLVTETLAIEVSRVRARLDELGTSYDRRPFVPHVTLFRDVRQFDCSGALAEPVHWRTVQVALYAATRDERGPLYRRIEATP